MTLLVLSIGSNVERERNIRFALQQLEQQFGGLRRSPVYQTAAVGFEGPDFYNLVVAVETELTLDAVLEQVRAIEAGTGRVRGEKRFQSRTLDIDVLLYGEAMLHEQGYDIPREEIRLVAYVLKPLADLLPTALHPQLGISFLQMWREHQGEETEMKAVPWSTDPGQLSAGRPAN